MTAAHDQWETAAAGYGSPAFLDDPYPVYARMRKAGPLIRSTAHRTWFVTSHAAVGKVLRSRGASVDSPFRASRVLFGRTVTDVEGEEHRKLRALTNHSFTAAAIPGYLEHLVPGVVHDVVDRLPEGRADLVADFANAVPIRVMSRIIGLQVQDLPAFQTCSDAIIAFLDVPTRPRRSEAFAAWERMRTLLRVRIDELRSQPDDSVIGQLLSAGAAGADVDDEEIVRQVGLLVPAAIDTSNRLLANVLHLMCSDRDAMATACNDPATVAALTEETLRFEPPIHSTVRTWLGGELFGVDLPRGSLLTVLLASANRDTSVFRDPDRFDLSRAPAERHLAFGAGRHQCMGRQMALAEVTTALTILLERCADIRFATDDPEPVRGHSFRSPARLVVQYRRTA